MLGSPAKPPRRGYPALDRIINGNPTAEEAASLLAPFIEFPTPENAMSVYEAFGCWSWRALTDRSLRTDLRDWVKLMNTVAAHYRAGYRLAHERIMTLCDLLSKSAEINEAKFAAIALKRKIPLMTILKALAACDGMTPKQLSDASDLPKKQVTNLAAIGITAGLISRSTVNSLPVYRLTLEGEKEVGGLTDALH